MAEFFIILFLIAIIVLMIIFKSHLTSKVRDLSNTVERFTDKNDIEKELSEIKRVAAEMKTTAELHQKQMEKTIGLLQHPYMQKTPEVVEKLLQDTKPPVVIPEVIKEPAIETPEILAPPDLEIQKEKTEEIIAPPIIISSTVPPKEVVEEKPKTSGQEELKPQKVKSVKDTTRFERFIGENLINKIGIAILVLGLGFFVKFAIDKNWINEWGRVLIGLAAGTTLVLLGHWLRKSYHAFSSVLVGGGMAVYYFSIAIAFREYNLVSQTGSFIIMVVITALAVLLSLRYSRLELAIIAMVGGFATPFMLSNNEGNYIVLFTYLIILNLGMLVLAYFKNWKILNLLAFIFTVIIFGGWLIMKMLTTTEVPYEGALVYATAFFIIFFLMNIINNIREKEKFMIAEVCMLIANAFLYFAVGMILLEHIQNGDLQGLFTSGIAIFNLVFALLFYKYKRVDKSLIFLLIGHTLIFISLIAPVQLSGNYITIFWAAEAVVLLWFAQKSGLLLVRIASIVVLFTTVIGMAGNWIEYYIDSPLELPLIINRAFITAFACNAAFLISIYLVKREKSDYFIGKMRKEHYINILTPFFITFLFIWLFAELVYQIGDIISYVKTRSVVIDIFLLAFASGLMVWARIKKNDKLFIAMSAIGLVFIFLYLFVFNFQTIFIRNFVLLFDGPGLWQFLLHYVEIILVFLMIYMMFGKLRMTASGLRSITGSIFLWFTAFVIVYIGSFEIIHISVFANYLPEYNIKELEEQAAKIGMPILWGVLSLATLFIGLKKLRMLRIISLSLFFITLLKLFIWDIRGISEAGRIAAFISLGVLLLVMSFLYQKLKKIIFDEDNEV